MSRHYWKLLAGTVLAMSPVAATAQALDSLDTGTPVRVWTDHHRGVFATLSQRGDRGSIFVTSAGDSLHVPDSLLTGLEYQSGRRTILGVAIGTGVGSLLGIWLGAVIGDASVSGCTEFLCELDAIGYAFGGLAIGAIAGGLIGVAAAPPAWKTADVSRVNPAVAFNPTRRTQVTFNGRSIGVRIRIGGP